MVVPRQLCCEQKSGSGRRRSGQDCGCTARTLCCWSRRLDETASHSNSGKPAIHSVQLNVNLLNIIHTVYKLCDNTVHRKYHILRRYNVRRSKVKGHEVNVSLYVRMCMTSGLITQEWINTEFVAGSVVPWSRRIHCAISRSIGQRSRSQNQNNLCFSANRSMVYIVKNATV